MRRLLIRDPKMRIGSSERDAAELKEHPFFREIDWSRLSAGNVIPPWSPQVAGSLDTSQFDAEFTSMVPTGGLYLHDINIIMSSFISLLFCYLFR